MCKLYITMIHIIVICLVSWAPNIIATSCENIVRLADLRNIMKNQTKLIQDQGRVIDDQKNMLENQTRAIQDQKEVNKEMREIIENQKNMLENQTKLMEDLQKRLQYVTTGKI